MDGAADGTRAAPLPAPVRAWGTVGRIGKFRGRARIGTGLVRRLVRPDRPYAGVAGFALRIDPDDYFQACMLLDIFDPVGIALTRRYARPGTVAIDGGAFIGYFTLYLARAVGHEGEVHSFECDPRVLVRLREHLALNRVDQVRLVDRALLDRTGAELELRLPQQLGFATVASGHLADVGEITRVSSIRLDDHLASAGIAPSRISFVKLDVEGVERAALAGMEETLRGTDAVVLVEVIPERMRELGQDLGELIEFMGTFGYQAWLPRLKRGLGARKVMLEIAGPGADADLLFVKRR